MAETTTTTRGTGGAAIVVPAGAAAPKFKVGDRVQARLARAFGTITGGRWQASQWCYEVKYETNGVLATWFESQLTGAVVARPAVQPQGGGA